MRLSRSVIPFLQCRRFYICSCNLSVGFCNAFSNGHLMRLLRTEPRKISSHLQLRHRNKDQRAIAAIIISNGGAETQDRSFFAGVF